MNGSHENKLKALNAYIAEVLAEMDGATKAAFMSLTKIERQAMMWTGFHMEGRA